MVAPGGAAAHLQIDKAVADAVLPDDFAHDASQRSAADRPADADAFERAPEPVEVARLFDQRASAHLADFIDPVAEGHGAVVDRHDRPRQRNIAAVDIDDA